MAEAQDQAAAPAPTSSAGSDAPRAAEQAKTQATQAPPSTDGQPTEAAKPAEAAKPEEAAPSYDGLKLPEVLKDDGETLAQFKALAGEVKLPADKAQALIDLHAGLIQRGIEAWKAQGEAWAQAVEKDPELGGAKLDATKTDAARALDRFGGKALREVLEASGYANHPELVRAFAKIGREFAEDKIDQGKPAPADPLRALYPNSPQMFERR